MHFFYHFQPGMMTHSDDFPEFISFIKKYFYHRCPIDWRNPFPYLIAISLEMVTAYYVTRNCAVILSLPVGLSRFMSAFAADLKIELNNLNHHHHSKRSAIEVNRKVCELIEFDSTARRYNSTYLFKS